MTSRLTHSVFQEATPPDLWRQEIWPGLSRLVSSDLLSASVRKRMLGIRLKWLLGFYVYQFRLKPLQLRQLTTKPTDENDHH